jgi:hypothetical protein
MTASKADFLLPVSTNRAIRGCQGADARKYHPCDVKGD